MEIDVKTTGKSPKNEWEAIDLLIDSQQNLVDAIHIIISFLENPEEENTDFHNKRMKEFVKPLHEITEIIDKGA